MKCPNSILMISTMPWTLKSLRPCCTIITQENQRDETDASLNVKYDTADHKKAEITKDGVKYYLTAKELKEDSKPENGAVVEGTTEITYVYEKAGNVLVHYVDEAGNTIAEDVKDTTDGSVSSAYDTTDNKPATINTKDGKLYVLVPTSTKGDENGKVTEGTTEVTYVYKEVKEGTTNGGSLTPSQPGSPSTPSTNPTSPVKPTDPSQPTTPANPETPTMPSAPVNGEAPQAQAASSEAKGQAELPNTGTEDNARLAALGLLGVLSGFGLVARKKKED